MLQFKRILSFILALVLTAGMLPVLPVQAEETETEPHPTEETVSMETVALETAPVTVISDETEPAVTETTETLPQETVSDETVPEETAPEETAPLETVPEETVPAETISEETVPEETVPEETVPETTAETIPEETEPLNFVWELDENGTLTVTGEGEIPAFIDQAAPWADQAASVEKVVISDGITAIGAHAFCGCSNLTQILLSNSVTAVDPCALPVSEILSAEFDGTVEQWFALGTDLPATCLQGHSTEFTGQEVNVLHLDEDGNILSMTRETFAPSTSEVNPLATKPTAPAPTNATWHRIYDYGTSNYKTRKGGIAWYSSYAGECDFFIWINRKEPDGSITPVDALTYTGRQGWNSTDTFMRAIEYMKLAKGAYYFSVSIQDPDLSSKGSTVSAIYNFPGRPLLKIDKPSGQAWMTINNFPAFTWNVPSNKTYLDGFELDVYYSESNSGAPMHIMTISMRHDYSQITKEISQVRAPFNMMGMGYYYFKVRALTNNPEKINSSDWTGLSSAYFYNDTNSTTDNSMLNPDDYEPFNVDEETRDETLAVIYAGYSMLAYSDTKTNSTGHWIDGWNTSALTQELKDRGFQNIQSYYYKTNHISGVTAKNRSTLANEHSSPFVIASKKVNVGGQVVDQIMVVFRGTYENEWYGNFDLTGTNYLVGHIFHESFEMAADQSVFLISRYIHDMAEAGYVDPRNVKITLTGHSRGGAVANLTAVYLSDLRDGKTDVPNKQFYNDITIGSVHAYTYATPNVATYSYIKSKGSYNNIFNYCLTDDFVPNLPLESWSWGKFGKTYWNTAEKNLKKNDWVMEELEIYRGSKPKYNDKNTKGIVEAMTDSAATVREYYNEDLYVKNGWGDNDIITTLYRYARDGLGAHKAGNPSGADVILEPSLHVTGDGNLKKLSRNIIDGGKILQTPLNDTHQAYSYYYGLLYDYDNWKISQLTSSGYDATTYSFVREGNNAENADPVQLACFQDFLRNQGFYENGEMVLSNAENLGWNPDDPTTWEGLTWDENGNLIGLDLRVLGISGHLDLTQFPYLQYADLEFCALTQLTVAGSECLSTLDCAGNYLTELDLTGCTELTDLDCSYNNLTELDVSACTTMARLICTDNKLTMLDLSSNPGILELETSGNYLSDSTIIYHSETDTSAIDADNDMQNPNPAGEYCETDLNALTAIYANNSDILDWDITNPGSFSGVRWVAVDNVYYIETVDLREMRLSGEADFSGCSYLRNLLLTFNDFTQITVDDCPELTTLRCEQNYLSQDNVDSLANLSSEFILTPQRPAITLATDDVAALTELASALALDWDAGLYAINDSLEWSEDEDGIWHLVGLNMNDQGASGEMDLSNFHRLTRAVIFEGSITSITLPESVTYVSLRGCEGLKTIHFLGDAPTIEEDAFLGVSAAIDFPPDSQGWDQHVGQYYGGNITWPSVVTMQVGSPTQLVGGSSTTLVAVKDDKPLTGSQITWSLAEEDSAYASITAAGKLTTRKVLQGVTITAFGHVTESGYVLKHEISILPLATQVEILCGETAFLDGQTVYMDLTTGNVYANKTRISESGMLLSAQIYPEDAMQDITWSVKGSAATIDPISGQLTPKAKGTVTVTATANDGSKKAVKATVTIGNYIHSIEIDPVSEVLLPHDSLALSATVEPEGAPAIWSLVNAADKKYVTLTAEGLLTVNEVYDYHDIPVQLTSKDGVLSARTVISIAPATDDLLIICNGMDNITGENLVLTGKLTLSARILNNEQTETDVVWTSSNPSVVSLTDAGDGTVTATAVGTGTAVINATTADESRSASLTFRTGNFVQAVSIGSKTDTFTVASGKKLNLTASVFPETVKTGITWSLAAEDSAYASITAKGVLTAKANLIREQEITVFAAATDGSGVTASQTITITPLTQALEIRDEEFAVISGTTRIHDLTQTDTLRVSAASYPENANGSVTWTSSNSKVAAIDSDSGEITCLRPGTVTITATANDGSKQKASFKLTVVKRVTELYLQDQALAGGKKLTLSDLAIVLAEDATNKKLAWSVTGGDTDFVTLAANGTLTAKPVTKMKTVTVTAQTTDGSDLIASCQISIYPITTKVALYQDNVPVSGTVTIGIGEELVLTPRSEPADACQDFAWSGSGKEGILTLDDDYVLHGTGLGTVTLTVSSVDGSTKKATLKIKVIQKMEELTLPEGIKVAPGKSVTLNADIAPSNTTSKTLKWEIIDGAQYATISRTGKLIVKKAVIQEPVPITIRASATDGSNVSATTTVYITPATTSVALFDETGSVLSGKQVVYVGESFLQLSASSAPASALQEYVWTVSNVNHAGFLDENGEIVASVIGPDAVLIPLTPNRTVTVTATANDCSGKKASFKILTEQRMEDLSLEEGVSVALGRSIQLKALISPANTTNKKLNWTLLTTGSGISLSKTGILKVGESTWRQYVTVLVESTDGSGLSYSMDIPIYQQTKSVKLLDEDGHALPGTKILNREDQLVLSAEANDGEITPGFRWTVSDPNYVGFLTDDGSIASSIVSPDPVTVQALKSEKTIASKFVTVKATATDGSGKSASFRIRTVEEMTYLSLGEETLNVAGGRRITMAREYNATATQTQLRWEVSDEAFASISQKGVLTAKKVTQPQTVVVTAYYEALTENAEDLEASCEVVITPATTKVHILDENDLDITSTYQAVYLDTPLDLYAISDPDGACEQEYIWKVSNGDYAGFVTEEGTASQIAASAVTLDALVPGKTVTVTATATDGTGKKATLRIKTAMRMQAIFMEDLEVIGGRSLKLTCTYAPEDVSDNSVDWEITGAYLSDGTPVPVDSVVTQFRSYLFTKPVEENVYLECSVHSRDGGASADFLVTIYPKQYIPQT